VVTEASLKNQNPWPLSWLSQFPKALNWPYEQILARYIDVTGHECIGNIIMPLSIEGSTFLFGGTLTRIKPLGGILLS